MARVPAHWSFMRLLLCGLPHTLVAGAALAPPAACRAAARARAERTPAACRRGEDALLQLSHKVEVVARSAEDPRGAREAAGGAGARGPTAGSNESLELAAAGVVTVALEGQGPDDQRQAVAELGAAPAPEIADTPAKRLGALGHALAMGVVYALVHALGPDHLGTLMTLSAAAGGPARAFKAGAAWGAGHCLGMVVLVAAFVCLGRVARARVDAWEHYGDYLIGASMVACAVYFMARESQYVRKEANGTEVLRGCSCHGPRGHPVDAPAPPAGVPVPLPADVPGPPAGAAPGRAPRFAPAPLPADVPGPSAGTAPGRVPRPKRGGRTKGSLNSLCTSSYAAEGRPCPDAENAPLLTPVPKVTQPLAGSGGLGLTGALLGVFQAACCPSGMIGVSFIVKLPTMDLAAFCASFALISVLGTGALALCWALLANTAACRSLSAKALYRASCGLTFTLGVAWIAATFRGVTLEFVRAG